MWSSARSFRFASKSVNGKNGFRSLLPEAPKKFLFHTITLDSHRLKVHSVNVAEEASTQRPHTDYPVESAAIKSKRISMGAAIKFILCAAILFRITLLFYDLFNAVYIFFLNFVENFGKRMCVCFKLLI